MVSLVNALGSNFNSDWSIQIAIHRAAVQPPNETSKTYALWQTRVTLFGSPEAARAAQGIVDTNTGPRNLREQEFKVLLDAIGKDLNA